MILFEDMDKPTTINVSKLVEDKIFNKVHFVFDTNGYNIYNIKGISPYTIIYPDRYIYHKLLISISSVKNKEFARKRAIAYHNRFTIGNFGYLKSYVNRLSSIAENFYKPLATMLSMCDKNLKFNIRERIMFNETKDVRSINVISNIINQMYIWLYDNNCIIKNYDENIGYMLDIAKADSYKNELFIFTPRSFLRNKMSRNNYEFMLSLIDRIQKNGGYFILIDEISKGRKQNLILETSAKIMNRTSTVINYQNSSTMILTNVVSYDIMCKKGE